MAAAVTVVVLVVVALLLAVGVLKQQRLPRTPTDWDIGSDDDWGPAGVREPRRPLPTSGAATALAELDEEAA